MPPPTSGGPAVRPTPPRFSGKQGGAAKGTPLAKSKAQIGSKLEVSNAASSASAPSALPLQEISNKVPSPMTSAKIRNSRGSTLRGSTSVSRDSLSNGLPPPPFIHSHTTI